MEESVFDGEQAAGITIEPMSIYRSVRLMLQFFNLGKIDDLAIGREGYSLLLIRYVPPAQGFSIRWKEGSSFSVRG